MDIIRHCNADCRADFDCFSLQGEQGLLCGGRILPAAGDLVAGRLFQKDVNLFAGGWGIAFKVLTAAVLVVLVLVFVREYRANRRKSREEAEPQKEESPEDQDGLF